MQPNLSESLSLSLSGNEVLLVRVEVGLRKGLPLFQILGLASQNTKESRDRIRLALEASGFFFPLDHIVVNLHPNHKPKKVSFFDLAISIGLLLASGQWQNPYKEQIVALGSVSLSGHVYASPELLELLWGYPMDEDTIFLLPRELDPNQLPKAKFIFLDHLKELMSLGPIYVNQTIASPLGSDPTENWGDICLTPTQMKAFYGLCYGILGRHHCIMIGNPGTGKTKLVKLVSQIQPPWENSDFEISGEFPFHPIISKLGGLNPRPFRKPHHTTTEQALVGGGNTLALGEVTLAHGGILFLDELTLFKERALESLREPMEEKKIEHARVHKRESYPADCLIIAALNPCPCGNYLNFKVCQCSKKQIRDYLKKISGPFLDRIPIHIHLFSDEEARMVPISRNTFKEKLEKAAQFRRGRKREETESDMKALFAHTEEMMTRMGTNRYSFRQKQNTMLLARTIADFHISPIVEEQHLLEAYEFVQNSLFFEEIK